MRRTAANEGAAKAVAGRNRKPAPPPVSAASWSRRASTEESCSNRTITAPTAGQRHCATAVRTLGRNPVRPVRRKSPSVWRRVS